MNKSNTFCVAPWIHAHVATNGNRRLCCVTPDEAPGEFAKLPWAEFKNSKYMKDIRLKMLQGVLPKECKICDYSNRAKSTRDVLNEFYDSKIEQLINETHDDGSTDAELYYLDYRSNLCNLRCRTCGPSSSSRYQEYINSQDPATAKLLFPGEIGKNPKSGVADFSNRSFPEFLQLIETQPIDRIYFAGGEPVIEPGHFQILDSFINRSRANDVILFYNSNVSFSLEIVKKWIERLGHFKEALISASIDGVGDICEYIRDGSSFSNIDRNIQYLKNNQNDRVKVFLDITVTSLNFFFLEQYAKYAIENDLEIFCKLMNGSDKSAPILRMESVDFDIRNKVFVRWNIFYQGLNSKEKNRVENLHQLLVMFIERKDPCLPSFSDSVRRLCLMEKIHSEKPKMVDLLNRDEFGSVFADRIKIESERLESKK